MDMFTMAISLHEIQPSILYLETKAYDKFPAHKSDKILDLFYVLQFNFSSWENIYLTNWNVGKNTNPWTFISSK